MKRFALAALLAGCVDNSIPPAAIANYDVEQQNCVATSATRSAADLCRAASRASFCASYPHAVNCVTDAGKE